MTQSGAHHTLIQWHSQVHITHLYNYTIRCTSHIYTMIQSGAHHTLIQWHSQVHITHLYNDTIRYTSHIYTMIQSGAHHTLIHWYNQVHVSTEPLRMDFRKKNFKYCLIKFHTLLKRAAGIACQVNLFFHFEDCAVAVGFCDFFIEYNIVARNKFTYR
jgi:hypothetical protein